MSQYFFVVLFVITLLNATCTVTVAKVHHMFPFCIVLRYLQSVEISAGGVNMYIHGDLLSAHMYIRVQLFDKLRFI